MEEERRLFYVAVTRAKDELYIMCPSEIGSWDGPVMAGPTRFLGGLDDGAVDAIRNGKRLDYRSFFPEPFGDQDGGFAEGDGWGEGFSGDGQLSDQPPITVPAPPGPRPGSRKAGWKPGPRGGEVSEPVTGERLRHGTFGEGTVLSFGDGKAVIDFDACGRKIITCRHARLFRVKGS
jgi:DNA helicase-2/ATP-dependent DNA helicase PcrA